MMFELLEGRAISPGHLEHIIGEMNKLRHWMTGKENAKSPTEIAYALPDCWRGNREILLAAKEMLVNQGVPIFECDDKLFFGRTNEERLEYLSVIKKRLRILHQGASAVSKTFLPSASELEPNPAQPELEL